MINESGNISIISQKKAYSISEHYLVEDSTLQFNFDLTYYQNTTLIDSRNCFAEVLIFEHYDPFRAFLSDSTKHDSTQYCIVNKTSTLFSLNVTANTTSARYYLLGLYVRNTSVLESVNVDTMGYERKYDIHKEDSDYLQLSVISLFRI